MKTHRTNIRIVLNYVAIIQIEKFQLGEVLLETKESQTCEDKKFLIVSAWGSPAQINHSGGKKNCQFN